MIKTVENYIKKYNLIEPNSKVVIALSGGVDSMVLFDIIKSLNYNIVIAHVNHKVRLESEIEEEYIRSLCLESNIPLEILHLEKIEKNFEAQAHERRYDFFINVCKKYNSKYLLTAHHADDNIETIFLNLMSGSNLYGYGGISNKLAIDDINIVRPLLLISKQCIKEYALKNDIKYFEDYTNALDDYTRNRIRHHIIPKLKEECPNILERSNSFSNQIHEAFDFIRSQSIAFLKDNRFKISSFNDLHPFLKKDIICLLLENYDIERSENLINDILDVISNDKPQCDYSLKQGFIFKKRYDECSIEKSTQIAGYEYEINSFDEAIDNEYIHVYLTKDKPINTNYIKLCYNSIVFPITIRCKSDGDRIKMPGGSKKVKDLFIDKKIPKELRDSTPIIIDGDGDIIWVYNVGKSSKISDYKDNYDCFLACEVKDNANR